MFKEDYLMVGYEKTEEDCSCLMVARPEGKSKVIINTLVNDEADNIYKKLTASREKCCETCGYSKSYIGKTCVCRHKKHAGDIVQKYTVCEYWI